MSQDVVAARVGPELFLVPNAVVLTQEVREPAGVALAVDCGVGAPVAEDAALAVGVGAVGVEDENP